MLNVPGPQSGLRPACRICGGTGKRMTTDDDQGGAVKMVMTDSPCPACRGTGQEPPK